MDSYNFDTLKQSEKLQQCGFSRDQANGLVEVIVLSQANLVTKQDLRYELSNFEHKLERKFENKFAEIEKKILKMTISLGAINVGSLGFLSGLTSWLN